LIKRKYLLPFDIFNARFKLSANIYFINVHMWSMNRGCGIRHLLFTENSDCIHAPCVTYVRTHMRVLYFTGDDLTCGTCAPFRLTRRGRVSHFLLSSPRYLRSRIFPWDIASLKRNRYSLWIRYQSLRKMSRKTTHLAKESGIIWKTLIRNFPKSQSWHESVDFAW
jgi:hypothetical protein